MRRSGTIVAAVALGAGLLCGCGSDDGGGTASSGDYCDTLKNAASTMGSFTTGNDAPDFSKVTDFIDAAQDLADQAPGDVADDWKVLVDGLEELTAVLADAGLTMEQVLTALATGVEPPGVEPSDLMALAPKLEKLSSKETEAAMEGIGKHAKQECGVDLSLSS